MDEVYENVNLLGFAYDSEYYHKEELRIFLKLRKKHRMPEWSRFLKWKPKNVSQKRFASKIKIWMN